MILLFNRRCLVFGTCVSPHPDPLPTERESPEIVVRFTKEHLANPALDFSKPLKTIPPLLEGEGRGEGEEPTFPMRLCNRLKCSSCSRQLSFIASFKKILLVSSWISCSDQLGFRLRSSSSFNRRASQYILSAALNFSSGVMRRRIAIRSGVSCSSASMSQLCAGKLNQASSLPSPALRPVCSRPCRRRAHCPACRRLCRRQSARWSG